MHTVTSKDGTAIAYDRSGTGPPLICVSAAMNERSSAAPLATLLAPHHTAFRYDRRGRGDSGDTAPYAVEREIEDLAAVIAEAGGSASVYGMSSGAALALQAAAYGLPITKLAIFEVPFALDTDEQRRAAETYATTLSTLLSEGRRADAVELFMAKVGIPAEMIGQMRHSPAWRALEALAPSLAYDSAVMGDSTRGGSLPTEQLAGITVPTLVMSGGASPAWMRDMARRVADTLPNGQHRTLEEQTHNLAPEALAPALEEFLAG